VSNRGAVGLSRRGFLGATVIGGAFGGSRLWAQAPVPLTFWVPGGSDVVCRLQNDLAADFAAMQTAAVVDTVSCIGNVEDFIQSFLAAIAAGNPPSASIVWETPVALGARGALLPIDGYLASSERAGLADWPEGLLASCRWNGQTFGVPVVAGSYGVFYNQEMFEAAGLPSDRASFPKTWDEMRRLSKEFTRWDGDYLERAGFLPTLNWATVPIWAALNGAQIYDAENNRVALNDERIVEMLAFGLDWINEEYKGDLNAIDRSGSFREPYPSGAGLPPAFPEGRQAGIESGSWLMGDLNNAGNLTVERWNVAPYAVGPSGSASVSGTWPNWLVIPKGSNDPDAAWSYIEFLSTDGVRKWFANVPETPGNINAQVDLPTAVVESRGAEFAADVLEFFRGQSAVATPMWNVPIQGFLNDQIDLVLTRVYAKEATPQAALAEAQANCEAELSRVMAELQ
jgi:multiple sugar transport system substrate-binding protein